MYKREKYFVSLLSNNRNPNINTSIMKKTINIFVFLLFSNTNIFAQINLVPNGDFEIYSSLPINAAQSNLAVGWNNVNGHYYPFGGDPYGSPDYLNVFGASFLISSFGAITPYSGNGQMGLMTYYSADTTIREYISTKLSKTMKSGQSYTISFYLSNGNGGTTAQYKDGTNNFGICFSTNPLHQVTHEVIAVTPQIEIDTVIYFYNNWHRFSFNFTADSLYKYITIGNFKNDANTMVNNYGSIYSIVAYYFIDKIEITPLFYILGDSVICKGNSTTIKMYGDSIANWVDSQQPASIIATDSIITVTPTTTTTYLAYSNSDTVSYTVHVVAPPIINLGNDTTLCEGQTIILNDTIPYVAYLWQDSSTNATYIVSQAGTYWVRAIIDSNCFSTDSIHVFYNPSPTTPTISQNGNVLTSSSATGNQWLLNGEAIPGDTNQSYTVPLPITSTSCYSVAITNIFGCSATSDTICFLPLGISELMKNKGMYAYPNPTTDNLTIETNFNEEHRLEIINLLGQMIYTTYIGRKSIINTSSYASGLYFLKIYTDKEIVVRKFVKE